LFTLANIQNKSGNTYYWLILVTAATSEAAIFIISIKRHTGSNNPIISGHDVFQQNKQLHKILNRHI
ncbi:MAG: hypothetical protein J6J61_09630, partial [Muribaculaceae bacterium]|nr:hypothetical protein [Muribaculaceae bacterium]